MGSASLPVPESDTESLVARAQAGDLKAFEILYHRNSGRVFGVCLRMARCASDAEEWAQDAWIRAWEHLESFRGDGAFSTWLHRLTVNVALDGLRKNGRRRGNLETVQDLDPAGQGDPSAALPGLAVDLERAIAALPEGARTIFLLHDVEGFKYREIAGRLGVVQGTVKSQLHRARAILREALER